MKFEGSGINELNPHIADAERLLSATAGELDVIHLAQALKLQAMNKNFAAGDTNEVERPLLKL